VVFFGGIWVFAGEWSTAIVSRQKVGTTYFKRVAPFGIGWALKAKFNATTRRCFERSIDKPALRLMSDCRLVIQEVEGPEVVTSYTRWIESVLLKEGENQEVYVTFNPRFEQI
jgi:hypothetical protein